MPDRASFVYPKVVRLRPSPAKVASMILVSGIFTLVGVLMIRSGDAWGWFCALFFGACLGVGAASAFPGASGLVVMEEGFATRSLFRTHFYAWNEVGDFGVFTIPLRHRQKKMVGFTGPVKARRAAGLSSFISGGYTHSLPDTYGLSAEDLVDALNDYRREALEGQELRARPGSDGS